jgi:hypothetical protein
MDDADKALMVDTSEKSVTYEELRRIFSGIEGCSWAVSDSGHIGVDFWISRTYLAKAIQGTE